MAEKRKPTRKPTPKKDWRDVFLKHLASTGVVSYSANAAKIHKSTAYDERERNSEFADKWEEAVSLSTGLLEAEAIRRARDGTLKPVYQSGELVGKVKEYSDTLLIFLLKSRDPKYRDSSKVTLSGDPANPLQVKGDSALTDQIDRLATAFEAVANRAGEGGSDGDRTSESVDPRRGSGGDHVETS